MAEPGPPDERRPFADLLEQLGRRRRTGHRFTCACGMVAACGAGSRSASHPARLTVMAAPPSSPSPTSPGTSRPKRGLQRIEKSERPTVRWSDLARRHPPARPGRGQYYGQPAGGPAVSDDLGDLGATASRRFSPPRTTPIFSRQPDVSAASSPPANSPCNPSTGGLSLRPRPIPTVMDAQGEPSGIVLFVRDVTDHLRPNANWRDIARISNGWSRAHLRTGRSARHAGQDHRRQPGAEPWCSMPGTASPTGMPPASRSSACPASQMVGTRDQWKAFYPNQRPIMADLVITGEMTRIQEPVFQRNTGARNWSTAVTTGRLLPDVRPLAVLQPAALARKQGRIVNAIKRRTDITERKRAEVALTDAKARRRSGCQRRRPPSWPT